MRIALISDLHGNTVALQTVLKDIQQAHVDRIVCLGDVATLGPRAHDVLSILADLQCVCIRGNHDDFLLDEELIKQYTDAAPPSAPPCGCTAWLGQSTQGLSRATVPNVTLKPENSTRGGAILVGSNTYVPEAHTRGGAVDGLDGRNLNEVDDAKHKCKDTAISSHATNYGRNNPAAQPDSLKPNSSTESTL